MTLTQLKSDWQDTPEYHKGVHEKMCELVSADPELHAHRTYIETNVYGFGERSFWWVWKLILAELPENPSLLEIGVFKAATLSVWKLLRKDAKVFGVTPLDESGGVWKSDYASDIKKIHDDFKLPQPHIFHGRSDDARVMKSATTLLYDVVYIDGDHTFEGALHDLTTYAPCVKSGGWLVIDDAACRTSQEFGVFQGIETVCEALMQWEKSELAKDFEWQFNVVHLMCYKRK